MKPAIAVLWVLSIALAVGLTRLAGPESGPAGSEPLPSFYEIFGEFDPLQRAYLFSHRLAQLGRDDIPELRKTLEERNMGITSEEVRLIMHAWARWDAPGAYEWAKNEATPVGWRTTLTLEAIRAWGYYDGPEAMRVAEAADDLETMERLRQNALDGWLRSDDKDGVSEYVANFPDVKRRGRLYFLLAGEVVMAEGMEAAMRWVEDLPDDMPNNLKMGVFSHVAKMVAGDNPTRAAEWLDKHRGQPYTEGAASGIALRWVQHHDRPAAFEWLLAASGEGLSEEEREGAISQGFRTWMQLDPKEAQAWLLSALPNPVLDPAIVEALRRLLPIEPQTAMEWAQRLDNKGKRNAELRRVGSRWRAKDPEAFDAWLNASDLSEEARQNILSAQLPRRRGGNRGTNVKPAETGTP